MSNDDDARQSEPRPRLLTRVSRGLSFMNKLALVLLMLGLLALAFKHS